MDLDLTTTTLDLETVEALPEAEALAVQVEVVAAADLARVDLQDQAVLAVQEDLPEAVALAVQVAAEVAADLAQVDLQDQEVLPAAVAHIPAEVTAAAVDNGWTMELDNTTIRLALTDLELPDTCTKLDLMAE